MWAVCPSSKTVPVMAGTVSLYVDSGRTHIGGETRWDSARSPDSKWQRSARLPLPVLGPEDQCGVILREKWRITE